MLECILILYTSLHGVMCHKTDKCHWTLFFTGWDTYTRCKITCICCTVFLRHCSLCEKIVQSVVENERTVKLVLPRSLLIALPTKLPPPNKNESSLRPLARYRERLSVERPNRHVNSAGFIAVCSTWRRLKCCSLRTSLKLCVEKVAHSHWRPD